MGRSAKDSGKPKGKMSAYAFFMQAARDERKKTNPEQSISLTEFSKSVSEKWKNLPDKERKKYDELAAKDSIRFKEEMADYTPVENNGKRKRGTKDPNAPKRALSAFFCFCNDERPKVKKDTPGLSVSEIAKELGKRWEQCEDRAKYEALAAKDKERYEKEKALYKPPTSSEEGKKVTKSNKKVKQPAKKQKASKEKKKQEEEDEENDEGQENLDDENEEEESD